MHRISPALRLAALGVFAAVIIALVISTDLFGALAPGFASPGRQLGIEQGSDVSLVPTLEARTELDTTAPAIADAPRTTARRSRRTARAATPLPAPAVPEAPSVATLPPLPPAPMLGVAALVPR